MKVSKRKICSCLIGILAVLSPALILPQTPEPTPIESERDIKVKQCLAQPIRVPRTYEFRQFMPRIVRRVGAYGKRSRRQSWYDKFLKILPFVSRNTEQYKPITIDTLKESYNLPVALGETKRSKEIRRGNEVLLKSLDEKGENHFRLWINQNPNATESEKQSAEIKFNSRGLKAADLPVFDWREQDVDVGSVGDQGIACNTCWAFSAVDAMQISRQILAFRFGIQFSPEEQLPSVRQLVSCAVPKQAERCKNNNNGDMFTFMVDEGLPLGGNPEYEVGIEDAKTGPDWVCDKQDSVKALTWDFVSAVPQSVPKTEEMKRAIVTYGPVVAKIAYDDCFLLYGSGVFNEEQNVDGNHFLLIIGWNDEKGAWLVKNSYGEGWGESGFGWIKYGSNNIGQFGAWVMADPKEEERLANQTTSAAN